MRIIHPGRISTLKRSIATFDRTMMEPTEEDSVPLRHGVGGGKAPSSSTFQWLPRKMPRVPDVGFKMAVFALFFSVFVGQIIMFAGQFLTLRELKEMNSKLTPPTPEILFAPPPPPPHVVPGGAIECLGRQLFPRGRTLLENDLTVT